MSARFGEIAFTPTVKRLQEKNGSRKNYGNAAAADSPADRLGDEEAEFIRERDSFYFATVSETGWPYLQHRGGPKGFLKVLDPQTIAFADFRGNLQYVSTGNLEGNDRVSLFLMDYANQQRLKLLGHAHVVEAKADPALIESLSDPAYTARVERAVVIRVEAFDWNCRQHITQRFTEDQIRPHVEQMRARINELESQLGLALKEATSGH